MIMASSSSTTSSSKSMIHVVEKPSTQEPLKCPRCDSSNTKFCYYNNYSLSQPRHFCKACKRYWTKGGTLRNVPVGGGCRKNKRVKRLPPSNNGGDVGVSTAVTKASGQENPSFLLQAPHAVDLSHSSSISTSSLLYNLPTAININNPLDFSFPFSNSSSSKVNSSDHHSAGFIFDRQPNQVNGLGIGFSSSSGLVENSGGIHHQNNNAFMRNGLMKNFLQDHVMNSSSTSPSSSPVFNSSNPISFGSSTAFSTSSSSTTMASLLALKDFHTINSFQGMMPYHREDHYTTEANIRGMKLEGQTGSGWNPDPDPNSNTYNISQINSSDDPSSNPLWNTNNVGSPWFDPSNNIGSSVSSLI